MHVTVEIILSTLTISELKKLAEDCDKERVGRADPPLDVQEASYMMIGNKIQAIKSYRERTGLSLGHSVDACNRFKSKL